MSTILPHFRTKPLAPLANPASPAFSVLYLILFRSLCYTNEQSRLHSKGANQAACTSLISREAEEELVERVSVLSLSLSVLSLCPLFSLYPLSLSLCPLSLSLCPLYLSVFSLTLSCLFLWHTFQTRLTVSLAHLIWTNVALKGRTINKNPLFPFFPLCHQPVMLPQKSPILLLLSLSRPHPLFFSRIRHSAMH